MKQFDDDQLRDMALEALAEAAELAGPRTKALSFAMSYLYSYADCPRAPFDAYWQAIRASDAIAAREALANIRKLVDPGAIDSPPFMITDKFANRP